MPRGPPLCTCGVVFPREASFWQAASLRPVQAGRYKAACGDGGERPQVGGLAESERCHRCRVVMVLPSAATPL